MLIYFFLGTVYLPSFFSKIAPAYIAKNWISGNSLRTAILIKHLDMLAAYGRSGSGVLQNIIFSNRLIAIFLSAGALLIEAAAIFMFAAPSVYKIAILSALLLLHVGNFLILKIKFRENMVIISFLLIAEIF